MGQSEQMEQEDNRPKWLLELENRKRKPRLAHEVGAGAPCMTCSTACPGLDLHFWRKICKNCKCSRDDHDVPNDEFPQFDLLFGPSGKPNRKMIVLKVHKKLNEAEATFEWAPPDTTKELAADYMKALPEDKLPIKGSAGAALRKQQLQRQLPLHDIDHKVCDELSESERKQFEKYLENLKKYVGQGKVIKAMGARPFDRSLMTPANATDMNRFSPKHKPNLPENGRGVNLRTPSSFVQKSAFPSQFSSTENVNGVRNRSIGSPSRDRSPGSSARMERVRSPALINSSLESPLQGRYHHALANVRNDSEISSSNAVGGIRNPPLNFATSKKIPESAYTSLSETNEPASSSRLESSFDLPNSNIASSDPVRGTHNPAVKFAAANMIADHDQGIPLKSEHNVKGQPGFIGNSHNRALNYATSNLLSDPELSHSTTAHSKFNSSRISDHNTSIAESSAVAGTYNPASITRQSQNDQLQESSDNLQSEVYDNSLLAEQMLTEALLPPSAIHAADIIGSTLDEKGLSFIREKLMSKYSAKDEPVNLQSSGRSRDLSGNEIRNGAKSKRMDQLRRQGAFDKESERFDISGPMTNPTDANLSQMEKLHDTQNCLMGTHPSNNTGLQTNINGSNDKNLPNAGMLKHNMDNEPWKQIMQRIWNNHQAKPGHPGMNQDSNYSESENELSMRNNSDPKLQSGSGSKSLHAELSSYGPGNSNVICSEGLHNPIFPEEAIVSSGIVENPVSVDRLRGAIEELSMNQSKTQNCRQCQEGIHPGDVVVTAEKATDSIWHPGCFVCSVCNELLADLVYFFYKGKLYCGRDLATLLEIPRCFACDELIFVREYTVAEGHNYHVKHFCCWDCDVPLAGQQYISENDRPLCLPCYQRTYAKTCRTCDGVIAADQQGVAVKNLNFHATDLCFCCAACKKSLLNGKMAIKQDRPFCSKECITKFLSEHAGEK